MNMKTKYLVTLVSFCASVMFTVNVIAADSNDSEASFSYAKPTNALPSRIGGSSRGTTGEKIQVLVIAPDHTGLTIREQPTLYWYQSDPTDNDIEITIVDDSQIEPVLEKKIKGSKSIGIHPLSLKELNIKLKKNIEYRWFVAIITNQGQRSTDVITGGTIMRVDKSKVNNGVAFTGTARDKFSALAKAGLWYDAIDTLSAEIDKTGNAELVKTREKILIQVGLGDAVKK